MFNLDALNDIEPMPPDDISTYDPRDKNGDKYLLPLHFNFEILDLFCAYVFDLDNEYIPHAALVNMKTMIEMLDKRPYMNNDELKARLEFIMLVLEARIDLNLDKESLITNYVLNNCDSNLKDIIEDELLKTSIENGISLDIANYINTMTYENLVNGYSLVYSQKLAKILDKKDEGGYKRISDFTKDFKNLSSELNTIIVNAEEYQREGRGFDLKKSHVVRVGKKILHNMKKPTNKLKTGIQYLNKMLNGGFEAGRSYLIMGITGVGKSITLLSIANWIRKYNKLPRKQTEELAVLFISQENSQSETFERLFNIECDGRDMKTLSDEEMIELLTKAGLVIPDDDNTSINFIFKEYSDKEIGVTDIDALISDYEKKNIRIIAVVQDYIEKLKPKFKFTELRHALGSVATELSELAKKRNIPVISAAQLNRDAAAVTDNAIANNKKNTIKLLGKKQISESWDMMKNVDAVILIGREYDDSSGSQKEYLGFKLEKFRGKPNKDKVFVFIHPFDENNGIELIADIDSKPLSKESIEDFNPFKKQEESSIQSSTTFNLNNPSTFATEFIDIIDDNYTDSSKNYTDLFKHAEEVSNRMRRIIDREKELKRQRLIQLKNKNFKTDKNGRAIIKNRKKHDDGLTRDESGRVIIKRTGIFDNCVSKDKNGRWIIKKLAI